MRLRLATPEDAELLAAAHARSFDASWSAPDIANLMSAMGGFAYLAEGEDADDLPLQGAPVHGGVRRVHDRHPIPLGVLAPGVSEPLGVVRCSA